MGGFRDRNDREGDGRKVSTDGFADIDADRGKPDSRSTEDADSALRTTLLDERTPHPSPAPGRGTGPGAPGTQEAASGALSRLAGQSRQIRFLRELLRKIAVSEATVLIEGETGTGKELVARAIHELSRRSAKKLLAHNCGATPDTLIESELFGHVKGAFTGAVQDKKGLFEVADGGTFFLDEIADVSAMMQIKLLRVLQEREFRRVGETQPRRIDVRIVAATNRDLLREVEEGRFRR
ncbi:MAG: sigma-54 factor interaction domain-containing protein, partial [Candidatus Eisenbacteria bacterium]